MRARNSNTNKPLVFFFARIIALLNSIKIPLLKAVFLVMIPVKLVLIIPVVAPVKMGILRILLQICVKNVCLDALLVVMVAPVLLVRAEFLSIRRLFLC